MERIFTKAIREKRDLEVFKCLKTGKEFIVSNGKFSIDGSNHITETWNIEIPSRYERKQYKLKNDGKSWYYQFFEPPVKYKMPEYLECPICSDWWSFDMINKSGAYTNHIEKVHGETIENFLKNYPSESKYFNKFNLEKEREKELSKEENRVKCLECNKYFKTISVSHLKTFHNMTVSEYKAKHNVINIISKTSSNKLSKNTIETNKKSRFKRKSNIEKEFEELLIKYNINYTWGERRILKGQELDFYLPDYKLGLEFNGVFYHSEINGNKNSTYHLNKTKECNEKSISLIHIFEDLTTYHKEKVFNTILNKLKVIGNYYNILETELKIINKNIALEFIKKYSFNEYRTINNYVGLYLNTELVMVLPTKSLNGNLHICDFIKNFNYFTDDNYSSILDKLLKYFNVDKIIFYSDITWSDFNDKEYLNSGFIINEIIKPKPWYLNGKVKRNMRFNRYLYSKKQLISKGMYIDGKNEWEIMQHHGFDRIWDCGNIKYIYNKKG